LANDKSQKARPAPACERCVCFRPAKALPESVSALSHVGHRHGDCLRFPATVQKLPQEFCFEFKPKEAS
jgi:hypothetical protein